MAESGAGVAFQEDDAALSVLAPDSRGSYFRHPGGPKAGEDGHIVDGMDQQGVVRSLGRNGAISHDTPLGIMNLARNANTRGGFEVRVRPTLIITAPTVVHIRLRFLALRTGSPPPCPRTSARQSAHACLSGHENPPFLACLRTQPKTPRIARRSLAFDRFESTPFLYRSAKPPRTRWAVWYKKVRRFPLSCQIGDYRTQRPPVLADRLREAVHATSRCLSPKVETHPRNSGNSTF